MKKTEPLPNAIISRGSSTVGRPSAMNSAAPAVIPRVPKVATNEGTRKSATSSPLATPTTAPSSIPTIIASHHFRDGREPDERHHPADGEVDAAGQDDERQSEGGDRGDRGIGEQPGHILRRGEIRHDGCQQEVDQHGGPGEAQSVRESRGETPTAYCRRGLDLT